MVPNKQKIGQPVNAIPVTRQEPQPNRTVQYGQKERDLVCCIGQVQVEVHRLQI